LLSALAAAAQSGPPIPVVRGELQAAVTLGGGVVNLRTVLGQLDNYETPLRADGSFEFHNVSRGSYTLTVRSDAGDTIAEENVEIVNGATVRVRAQSVVEPRREKVTGTTVPVSELRHPPSQKTLSILAKAHHAAEAGDHAAALRELEHAAEKNPSDGYLQTNLGIEYLQQGRLDAAIPVLEEAARLLPDSPMTLGNLAYVYYLTKQWNRAEHEARVALAANHGDPKTRYLLGASLLAQGHSDEGLENLRLAREAIPQARVALAQYYLNTGRKDAACTELRAYSTTASPVERVKIEKWLAALAAKP
jgi:Flp pilus assembly protein TadD